MWRGRKRWELAVLDWSFISMWPCKKRAAATGLMSGVRLDRAAVLTTTGPTEKVLAPQKRAPAPWIMDWVLQINSPAS